MPGRNNCDLPESDFSALDRRSNVWDRINFLVDFIVVCVV